MHTEYHKWYSSNLNKNMELKVYGHAGMPYIVFPCSKQNFFDFETWGMIDAIRHFIDSGKIRIVAIGSVDEASWYNWNLLPGERNAVYESYVKYVTDEVLPFVRNICHDQYVKPMVTGASMGAYHAVNFYFKRPDLFSGVVALSGLYRLDREEFKIKSFDRQYVYYNSPIQFVPNINDQRTLDLIRNGKVYICTGQGNWEKEAIEDTRDMDYTLNADKKLGAHIEYWGHDVAHDWPWWFKQMNHFLHLIHG